MKTTVMKKWVKALRSGKYRQLKGALKAKSKSSGAVRHCCLGVLCELYQKEKAGKKGRMSVEICDTAVKPVDDKPAKRSFFYRFGSERDMYGLPTCVSRWAGIKSEDGALFHSIPVSKGYKHSLAELNDAGYSFAKIADVIEAQAKEL